MSTDDWRWEQKAQRLRFEQLEVARKQAENWRTGLAGMTTLLGAVLIVKGRDNISDLQTPYRWAVTILFGLALTGLATATMLAVRAASGTPTRQSMLSGRDLSAWTAREVPRIRRTLAGAAMLSLSGVALSTIAVGLAWLGPANAEPPADLVTVRTAAAEWCGTLVEIGEGNVVLSTQNAAKVIQTIPLGTVTGIRSTGNC